MSRFRTTTLASLAAALIGVATFIVVEKARGEGPADGDAATAAASIEAATQDAIAKAVAVGQVPPDFSLAGLDGQTVKLSEQRGKVVVLDFWGTWCVPCRIAMPRLQAMHERYADKPFAVLPIDVGDPKPLVARFAAQNGFTLPFLLDAELAVSRAYDVSIFPTTYVIGADGKVRARFFGIDDEAGLNAAVADALAEVSSSETKAPGVKPAAD